MSEADPKPKKVSKPKKPAEHPKYDDMISEAIKTLADRKGSSRQAVVKFINANYKVGEKAEVHIKQALKRGVSSGKFTQVKGVGASGSFKLNKAVQEKKPKKTKKPAKPKTPAKKPAAKKPAAKKSAKKPSPKKSAEKKKKPAKKSAAKKDKKPAKKTVKKSPKKAPKSPAKTKKSPAKKSAKKSSSKKKATKK